MDQTGKVLCCDFLFLNYFGSYLLCLSPHCGQKRVEVCISRAFGGLGFLWSNLSEGRLVEARKTHANIKVFKIL